jgi:hypothetical protein
MVGGFDNDDDADHPTNLTLQLTFLLTTVYSF